MVWSITTIKALQGQDDTATGGLGAVKDSRAAFARGGELTRILP